MKFNCSRVVVIAPHPDDETLGLGGTLSKLTRLGSKVSILVLSGHLPPLYPKNSFAETKKEAIKAFEIMGVNHFEFSEIPATFVHEKPVSELNGLINKFIQKHNANLVFIPFPDRHIDHRVIFDASVVACRPVGESFPQTVLAYETLSETHWNVQGVEPSFLPDLHVDITKDIESKKKALAAYASQITDNSPRSIEACLALAKFRGSQNGCGFAESFKVVRIVL